MFSSGESLNAFFLKVKNMEQNYFSMSQYVLMPSVCINYLLKTEPGRQHRLGDLKTLCSLDITSRKILQRLFQEIAY